MVCAKYTLVLIDIVYLIMSLVMIIIGVLGKIALLNFLYVYQFEFLPTCWIATGVTLLFVSIFGLIGAFRESKVWTNIFGLLLTISFVTQISSAIYAFQFIGRSESIASTCVERLMYRFGTRYYRNHWAMDWIQRNYKCCGDLGLIDFAPFASPSPLPEDVPPSCCSTGYNNLPCSNFYQNGCSVPVREMTSAFIMIIGSVALVIAVFEVLGIALAFGAARLFRKNSSTVQLHETFDIPTANREQSQKGVENVETI